MFIARVWLTGRCSSCHRRAVASRERGHWRHRVRTTLRVSEWTRGVDGCCNYRGLCPHLLSHETPCRPHLATLAAACPASGADDERHCLLPPAIILVQDSRSRSVHMHVPGCPNGRPCMCTRSVHLCRQAGAAHGHTQMVHPVATHAVIPCVLDQSLSRLSGEPVAATAGL